MCGELEEEDRFLTDLHQRFLVHARDALRRPARGEGLHAYLDALFHDVLKRCVDDAAPGSPGQAYERMAMQSLVLARLAGYLAGHVALNEDPMRKALEALVLGYQEADQRAPAGHHHHHHHDDDGHHDHGHGHGHAH